MSKSSNGAEFFAGLVIGSLVGAALAILIAPQSGEETLAQLREKSYDLKNTAGESLADARRQAGHIAADARTKAETMQSQAKATVSKMTQRGQAEANEEDEELGE